jgi:hypothetical protein
MVRTNFEVCCVTWRALSARPYLLVAAGAQRAAASSAGRFVAAARGSGRGFRHFRSTDCKFAHSVPVLSTHSPHPPPWPGHSTVPYSAQPDCSPIVCQCSRRRVICRLLRRRRRQQGGCHSLTFQLNLSQTRRAMSRTYSVPHGRRGQQQIQVSRVWRPSRPRGCVSRGELRVCNPGLIAHQTETRDHADGNTATARRQRGRGIFLGQVTRSRPFLTLTD